MNSEGKRIRLIRQKLDLTQQEFAKALGVNPSFISGVESDNKFLSREKLHYLLVTYNVNINYILAGIGTPFINAPKDEDIKADFEKLLQESGFEVDENGYLRRK